MSTDDQSNEICVNGNDCFNPTCSKTHEQPFCLLKAHCQDFDCNKRHTKLRKRKCENIKNKSECTSIETCKFLHPGREYGLNGIITQEKIIKKLKKLNLISINRKIVISPNLNKNKTKIQIFGNDCEKVLKKLLKSLQITINQSKIIPPKPSLCSSNNLCFNEACKFYHKVQFCKFKERCSDYYCKNRHTKSRQRCCNKTDCPKIETCKFLHPMIKFKVKTSLNENKIFGIIKKLNFKKETRKFTIKSTQDNFLIRIDGEDCERIASILKNRVKKYAVPYENNIILSKYIYSKIERIGFDQFLSNFEHIFDYEILEHNNIYILTIQSRVYDDVQQVIQWIDENEVFNFDVEIDYDWWEENCSAIKSMISVPDSTEIYKFENKCYLKFSAESEEYKDVRKLINLFNVD